MREGGGNIPFLPACCLGPGISESTQTAAARIHREELDLLSVQSVQKLPFRGIQIRGLCAAGCTTCCSLPYLIGMP